MVNPQKHKAKVNIYVEDWSTWIQLFVEVSGEEPWAHRPKVLQITKTLYEQLSILQTQFFGHADYRFLRLRKAKKIPITNASQENSIGYIAPDDRELPDD